MTTEKTNHADSASVSTDGLGGSFAQGVKVQIPSSTFEQEMQNQRRIGYEQGKKAAVLEAQKQEPVAEFVEDESAVGGAKFKLLKPLKVETKLYAAPVVQPDIDVIAEYTGQDGKREWKDVGAWLRPGEAIAVIAAAEGKK